MGSGGRIFVGSLYATPDSKAAGGFTYTLVAQKFRDVPEITARQDCSYNAQYLYTFYPDNVVREFWYLWDNATGTMTVVWDEANPTAGSADPPTVAGMAWTSVTNHEPYHYIDEENLIGPCRRITNPQLAHGMIYVGCVVDRSRGVYQWDSDAPDGRIDLFRVEIRSGSPTYLGAAPVFNGTPKLAIRDDGQAAIVSTGVKADGRVSVVVAFGNIDPVTGRSVWGHAMRIGDELSPPRHERQTVDANAQAVLYRDSGALWIIIKERFVHPGVDLRDPDAATESIFRKQLVAVHPKFGLPGMHDLDIGNKVNRTVFNPTPAHAGGDLVFDDLADSLVQLDPGPYNYGETPLGDEYRRAFLAVGDFGVVQFAEILEVADALPGVAVLQTAIPASAAPASTLSAPLMGVLGTALVGLFALRLALNRVRTGAAAAARGK